MVKYSWLILVIIKLYGNNEELSINGHLESFELVVQPACIYLTDIIILSVYNSGLFYNYIYLRGGVYDVVNYII